MATKKSTLETRRRRVAAILPILKRTYPQAKCSLDYSNPLELIVATVREILEVLPTAPVEGAAAEPASGTEFDIEVNE